MMTTERALTLALVLVAVGYGPGAIPYALERSAATGPSRAVASSRSGEACTAAHENERRPDRAAPIPYGEPPARAHAVPASAPREIVAPRATPNPFAFLTPPSERGPPALG